MCRWGITDLGAVVLDYLKLVHQPVYDVKQDTNGDTVSISVLTLGGDPALNRRRVSGLALQSERAILKDLFCSHGVQLKTQFVAAWKFRFEQLFQELAFVSLEGAERGIHETRFRLNDGSFTVERYPGKRLGDFLVEPRRLAAVLAPGFADS